MNFSQCKFSCWSRRTNFIFVLNVARHLVLFMLSIPTFIFNKLIQMYCKFQTRGNLISDVDHFPCRILAHRDMPTERYGLSLTICLQFSRLPKIKQWQIFEALKIAIHQHHLQVNDIRWRNIMNKIWDLFSFFVVNDLQCLSKKLVFFWSLMKFKLK